jgi:hypothetical protein
MWTKRGERGGGDGPAGHEPGRTATQGVPWGPLCRTWSSIDYLPNCIIFTVNFVFVVAVCHPILVFLYIFSAQHVETSTYQK